MSAPQAIILAGATATRSWPLPRARLPKSLPRATRLPTLLETTVATLQPVFPRENILIVASEESAATEAFKPLATYAKLLEPAPRGTAPAIALAAMHFLVRHQDPVMVIVPANHAIADEPAFHASLRTAIAAAAEGKLVAFGIPPTGPETRFGYVKARRGGHALLEVERFQERSDPATAAAFLAEGDWYWNASIFAWNASAIVRAIEDSLPAVSEAMYEIYMAFKSGTAWQESVRKHYARTPEVSIGAGVLEKTHNLHLVAADCGWSHGESLATIEPSATVTRPWGTYTVLSESPGLRVKRLEMNPGGITSLHAHQHRSEHWVVMEGRATVITNGIARAVGTRQSTFVPAGAKHRLENRGLLPLVMVEVQVGEYVGEDDVQMYE